MNTTTKPRYRPTSLPCPMRCGHSLLRRVDKPPEEYGAGVHICLHCTYEHHRKTGKNYYGV